VIVGPADLDADVHDAGGPDSCGPTSSGGSRRLSSRSWPERLLKSCLLIAFYSVRSERQFCERLQYDLLFKSAWKDRLAQNRGLRG
jgi:hypothetical protein